MRMRMLYCFAVLSQYNHPQPSRLSFLKTTGIKSLSGILASWKTYPDPEKKKKALKVSSPAGYTSLLTGLGTRELLDGPMCSTTCSGVMPGCKVMIAIETAKLSAKPDPDSAYWN